MTIESRIKIFSYSFIFGTGLCFALAGTINPQAIFGFFGFTFSYYIFFWLLAAGLAVLSVISYKKTFPYLLFSVLCAVFFGMANYYRFTDLSNPYHIKNYLDPNFFSRTTLVGTVIADPDVRDDRTNMVVSPLEIIKRPGKAGEKKVELKGKTGLLLVTVRKNDSEYYNMISHGDMVRVNASLTAPRELSNPAGFDYGKYLESRDIYATMYVKEAGQIEYLGNQGSGYVMRLALKLKRRILLTIRKTMPYPESAFLGGVTLGMRGGVPLKMKKEFQATGVAHVLAVSGLHVGFVAFLLVVVTNALRLKKTPKTVIVIFGLIIFTLITGASPATRRAALMFSIGLLVHLFRGLDMSSSSKLTIPFSALILLLLNPRQLIDGSFVLSYMAVWSLAHMTDPVEAVLAPVLKGFKLVSLIFLTALWTGIFVIRMELFYDRAFSSGLIIISLIILLAAHFLDRTGYLSELDMAKTPEGIRKFFYAQFAIQIGMMYPLSAFYFNRLPVAGVYANFIAIPLIGFIVQLGLVAGLINTAFTAIGLGAIGLQGALLLQSVNYYLVKFFILLSSFFGTYFPYPFISSFSNSGLLTYYLIVLLFVMHQSIISFAGEFLGRVREVFSEKGFSMRMAAVTTALVLIGAILAYPYISKSGSPAKLVIFDAAFGSAVYIRSPQGKNYMIDAGLSGAYSPAENVIMPSLSVFNVKSLEGLFVTNFRAQCAGGVLYLLRHNDFGKVFFPFAPEPIMKTFTYREFLDYFGEGGASKNPVFDREMQESYYVFHNIMSEELEKNRIMNPVHGERIGFEITDGREFYIKVLWPPSGEEGKVRGLDSNSLVLQVVHGKRKILIPSGIDKDTEWKLIDMAGDELKSDILLLGKQGHNSATSPEFMERVAPAQIIAQYGYSKGYSFNDYILKGTFDRAKKNGVLTAYRTDQSGAVTVIIKGDSYEIEPFRKATGITLSEEYGPDYDEEEQAPEEETGVVF